MKYVSTYILILLILIPYASSVCTVTLNDDTPITGEVITAAMSCSDANERNQNYNLNWYDQDNNLLQTNTGTTPGIINEAFYQTFEVPILVSSGTVNLTGTNLEGSDSFTVQDSTNGTLLLTNATFTSQILIGKNIGINFLVKDNNSNEINGALCTICAEDEQDVPLGSCDNPFYSVNGIVNAISTSSFKIFKENKQYIASAHCLYDINGDNIFDSSGIAEFPFNTSQWLTVNTLTNSNLYFPEQEIFICANVTNNIFDGRVGLKIYHQVRCSSDSDNDYDLDRSLIISDDDMPDRRGISKNTIQNQCKKFILPETNHLAARNSTCYASTRTVVIGEENNELVAYDTTSPSFILISDTINLNADWEYLSNVKLKTIINLSDPNYNEYNGSLKNGNIDIRLNKALQSIRHEDQFNIQEINIDTILEGRKIKSMTASYCNGTKITPNLEFLNDGNLEIELRNVDTTRDACYDVEVTLDKVEDQMLSITIGFIFLISMLMIIAGVSFWLSLKDKENDNIN